MKTTPYYDQYFDQTINLSIPIFYNFFAITKGTRLSRVLRVELNCSPFNFIGCTLVELNIG